MVKNIFPLIIVGFFGLIAGLALLHKGLPPTHDGEYHVIRFYEFYQTLQDGDWYPRWAPHLNNGYGVPLFNYVYPLPNYIASFLHFLGTTFIDSFKLSMFFATILGAVFFYLWTKEFWGRIGGIVSSIFYTFSPYHFLDIYIRGSVGEVWALALFPAFLWSVTIFLKHKKRTFFLLSSLFLALIIFSHNILALMFLPFSLTYIVFLIYHSKNKKYLILNTFYIILLGLGLSAIFWLPALLEKQYVTGLQVSNFSDHFPEFYQLIIPSWGSGFSAGALQDQLSFQIGIANLTAVIVVLFSMLFRHSGLPRISLSKRFWMLRQLTDYQNDGRMSISFFFLVWFVLIFFLMLKISKPVWEHIYFMNYFQFPWRLLSLEILVASFLAGSIIYFLKLKILAILLIFLSFALGIGYSKPAYYHYRDDNYYISRSNFIDGTNSPGNTFNTVFLKTIPKKEKGKAVFLRGDGKIEQKIVKSTMYVFNIKAESNSEILVNSAYFPGWKVYIDESEVEIKNRNGIIYFFLPIGEHVVKVLFKNTFVVALATFISIASFLVLIFLFTSRLFGTIRK